MALAVYFHPEKLNAAQYDEVVNKLQAAGAWQPKGRLHHSCFGTGDNLMVYEVWESQADFEAFGAQLMPIVSAMGMNPGQPDVMPLHNIVNS
jgi:hypothetical protein